VATPITFRSFSLRIFLVVSTVTLACTAGDDDGDASESPTSIIPTVLATESVESVTIEGNSPHLVEADGPVLLKRAPDAAEGGGEGFVGVLELQAGCVVAVGMADPAPVSVVFSGSGIGWSPEDGAVILGERAVSLGEPYSFDVDDLGSSANLPIETCPTDWILVTGASARPSVP
jgi:hypothetical protein